jgi:hypothetical protein
LRESRIGECQTQQNGKRVGGKSRHEGLS